MISTVFFDLDGTFADTAPDLAAALNQLLKEHGQPNLSMDEIRPTVSLGGNAMIKLAFGIDESSVGFNSKRQRFLDIYSERMHNSTKLFQGMQDVINTLESDNIIWGIITNKPAWLTDPLMQKLDMEKRAACIISGDTTNFRKPHPAPMHHACELTHSKPENTLYVGDARRDIEAGRAAGMHTLIALYGYISSDEDPDEWLADGMVSNPHEIITWLRNF